jgi:glycerophosphoryl diester phosphodiesterase
MKVISHRGISSEHPENTIKAFQEMVGLGVYGIEADVRVTADNVAILYHDRYCYDRPVLEMTRREVSARVGYEVPKLKHLLEKVDGVMINLEIKTPLALNAVLNVLDDFPGRDYMITSFWYPVIRQISKLTNYPCGLVVTSVHDFEFFKNLKTEYLVWDIEFFDIESIEKLPNKKHILCGVRGHEKVDSGIWGVITDFPKKFL